jgi:hypothetical protein
MMPVPGETSLATIQSQPLRARLAVAWRPRHAVSAAKPTTRPGRPFAIRATPPGCRGFRQTPATGPAAACLLHLPVRRVRHPPVGHRRREDGNVGGQRPIATASSISRAVSTRITSTPAGGGTLAGPVTKLTRAPPDRAARRPAPCPARPRTGWRCSAPGRSVHGRAEVTSTCRPFSGTSPSAASMRRRSRAPPPSGPARIHRRPWRRHRAPPPGCRRPAACDCAASRDAPTSHVHRGRDQHALVGRHQQRRGQIIVPAVGHLRHQVGGGRRHDHQIGGAAQLDMAHLRLVGQVEEIAIDLLPASADTDSGVTNSSPARVSTGHVTSAPAPQPPDQVERLEGRDPAADDQKDALAAARSRNACLADSSMLRIVSVATCASSGREIYACGGNVGIACIAVKRGSCRTRRGLCPGGRPRQRRGLAI